MNVIMWSGIIGAMVFLFGVMLGSGYQQASFKKIPVKQLDDDTVILEIASNDDFEMPRKVIDKISLDWVYTGELNVK